MKDQEDKTKNNKLNRRDVIKGLATIPVLGAVIYGAYKKRQYERYLNNNILDELKFSLEEPEAPVKEILSDNRKLRVGIIGYGIRGEQLLKAAGYAHPELLESWKKASLNNEQDTRFHDYQVQENLNIDIKGVCDIFDYRAERAMAASANVFKNPAGGKMGEPARRYKNYKDLLNAPDIDAVIIATPDHWHAQMAIDASKAGKHVYLEKGMTRTAEEAFELTKVVKDTGIIFQLGHQGRQTESYNMARRAIKNDVLGKITLVEVATNRNSPNGAWVYDIHPDGSPRTIDWEQFLGPAPYHPFSLERFFRWRCWWDYGTGLSGDLLTHEFDALNQVLELGIPDSVSASGGVYFYKDGREVPDVYHAVHEYKNRDLTLLYTATLASNRNRGKVIMGHDGNMELGQEMTIFADRESTKYGDQINKGIIDPSVPIYRYVPGQKNVDAITSATEKYFAGRGLLYTYRDGKRVDTTHLHIREWLDSIRKGVQPSCNIDEGFQEAIAAHMGTISLLENRTVFWDKTSQKIV